MPQYTLDTKKRQKVIKLLRKVTYCTLCSIASGKPHATMVQPAITDSLEILVIAREDRKKVRNLESNPATSLVFDATGVFRIPKAVYIEGIAEMEYLTGDRFDHFLSHHGWITRRILTKLMEASPVPSVLITVFPRKLMTVGVFGSPEIVISFKLD